MHVLRAMNRRELVATVVMFLAIIILWSYGVYLIASSTAESLIPSPIPPASSFLTDSPTPAPDDAVWAAHPGDTVQSYDPAKSAARENFILIYFIAILALTAVVIYLWRRVIYLPIRATLCALELIEPVSSYDFSPHSR